MSEKIITDNNKLERAGAAPERSSPFVRVKLDHRHAPVAQYTPRDKSKQIVSTYHGQRKLLDVLVEFLTIVTNDIGQSEPITLLYVGAASGVNIGLCAKYYFPNIEYHLYDPREILAKKVAGESESRVHVYQEFFTDELAKSWADKKLKNLLYVCDIRFDEEISASRPDVKGAHANAASGTQLPVGGGDRGLRGAVLPFVGGGLQTKDVPAVEKSIEHDMVLQANWYRILKARYSMLKLHLPYIFPSSTDVVVKYPAGEIYLQPFAPHQSTETRLFIKGGADDAEYSSLLYENELFYFNTKDRQATLSGYSDLIPSTYDFYREFAILVDYYMKIKGFGKELADKQATFDLGRNAKELYALSGSTTGGGEAAAPSQAVPAAAALPMAILPHGSAPSVPYAPRDRATHLRSTYHGQRKLLDVLVEFLTIVNPPDNSTLVYVGAAPGTNIGICSMKYFPNLIYHLYDPREYNLKHGTNLTTHNEFFTDEIAKTWTDKNIIYVCDIRLDEEWSAAMPDVKGAAKNQVDASVSKALVEAMPVSWMKQGEHTISRDSELQLRWMRIMKPKYSMLKFHPPWIYPRTDNVMYEYADGTIYFQPFAPLMSTETRLYVPEANTNKTKTYDCRRYENELYSFNIVERQRQFDGFPERVDSLYDPVREYQIFYNYYTKIKGLTDTAATTQAIEDMSQWK